MSYSYTDLCGIMEGCPEAITLLHSAGSDDTYRTLIAATRTTIYASNDRTGNWRILADGLGGGFREEDCSTCSSRRFRAAQLGNYVLFTNNFNTVMSWKFGDPPTGLDQWSVEEVEELLIVGITRARCITTFNGFMLLGNVELDGQHLSSRIYWSDYNAPLSWLPSDLSLASYHEFGTGEKVLRMEQLGRFLMVYTDKMIYQGTFVGGDILFQFNAIPTDNPLVYEHSLVNTGNAHIYGSHNGIYVVTSSDPRPVRYEWIHKADAAIYVGVDAAILGGFEGLEAFGPINKEECEQFVGGYNELTEELWFSWPTSGQECPNMSLVLNLRYSAADLVDHGFTAFANYKPDYRPNIRDWLNSECACPVVASDFVKEGLPIDDQYCYTYELGNAEQVFTASCPEGQTGDDVTVTIPADTFTAATQEEADALALVAAMEQAQAGLVCVEEEEEDDDMPLDQAIYVASEDAIFAVRGQWVYRFNATTGAREAEAVVSPDCLGLMSICDHNGIIYVSASFTQTEKSVSGANWRNHDIFSIDPTTLAATNTNIWKTYWGPPDTEYPFFGPNSLASDGTYVWGALIETSGYNLFFVNPASPLSLKEDSVGGNDAGSYPANAFMFYEPVHGEMVLCNPNNNDIAGYVSTGGTPPNAGTLSMGGGFSLYPVGACYSPSNTKIYAVDGTSSLISATWGLGAVNAPIATGVADANPRRIRYNAVDGLVYVPCWAANVILILDPATDTIVDTKTGFSTPWDVVFTPTKAFAVQNSRVGLLEIT